MSIVENISNKFQLSLNGNAQAALGEMMSQTNTIAILATLQLRVYVPPHPLIKHWLGVARDAATPSVLFRSAMTELGRWLTYEARDWLPTEETMVQTLCYLPCHSD